MKKFYLFLLLCCVNVVARAQSPYCAVSYGNPGGACSSFGMFINSFTLVGAVGSINEVAGTVPCNNTGYLNRTSQSTTLYKGLTYSASLGITGGNPCFAQAWIDFNNNNAYETSETVGFQHTQFTGTTTFNIVIPGGVPSTTTRLRVATAYYSGVSTPLVPCPTYTYGETREYTVVITNPPPSATVAPNPLNFGNIVVGDSSIVRSFYITASYLSTPTGTITCTPTSNPPSGGTPSDFWISKDNFTFVQGPLDIAFTGSALACSVYVKFKPTSYSSYSGSCTVTGGGIGTPPVEIFNGIGVFPCSGTPTAGTAAISPSSGGNSTPFTLSVSGFSTGGGLTFQWQSSAYSTFGFTDIPGATTTSFGFTGISSNMYYRCVVSCPYSGLSATTTAVAATWVVGPPSCVVTSTGDPFCCYFTLVSSAGQPFVVTGEAGTSISDVAPGASGTRYFDYAATKGLTLNMGKTYTPGAHIFSYSNQQSLQMWIDFNSDGIFSTSESVGGGNVGCCSSTLDAPLTIPGGLTPGLKRMRATVANNCCGAPQYPSYPSINPCGGAYYQEARDYYVNLQYPACSGAPVLDPGADTIISDRLVGCTPYTANLLYFTSVTSSNLTYQWQSSPNNSTWTNIAGATTIYYPATVAASTYYRVQVKCGANSSFTPSKLITLYAPPSPIAGSGTVCTANPVTMTSTPTGGTWTSSNAVVAVANITSGLVTGVNPGLATITYTALTGCSAYKSVTVNTSPQPITGSTNVCQAGTTTLANVTTGGVWSSSNITAATVVPSTGVVTGGTAGIPVDILYTMPNTCFVTYPMTVNPPPSAITGNPVVCVGSTTQLSDAVTGGTWSSSNSSVASVVAATGLVTGVSTGGSPVITYTSALGCYTTQAITVNALPAPITGVSNICVGATSPLTGSGAGTWASANSSIASVTSGGVITGVASGYTDICFTSNTTGCSVCKTTTVNLLPPVYAVSGGGGYCVGGTGVHIGITNSTTGINYELSGPGGPWTMPGTGTGLDFGLFTTTGSYTVQATNATTTCQSNMTGSATVFINPLPNNTYTVTGGGVYCGGGSGVVVGGSNSELGVSYQLWLNGTTPVGSAVAGTGGPISFGLKTIAGIYTVVATNTSTLCTANLTGSATVTVNTPPTAYVLSIGANYCAGGSGVPVTLANSDLGVNYQLYNGVTPVGTPMAGTGGMLSFGAITTPGSYTVIGTDATPCSTTMTGVSNIGVNPLPTVYAVTGGGAYCAGGTGVHVGLNYSEIGTDYELYLGGVPTGNVLPGSNSGLDFGLVTGTGVYTVVAKFPATSCQINMTGSVTISINPLPTVFNVTGGGGYCIGAAGSVIGIDGSETGVAYQLYRGMTPVGGPIPGTGAPLSFGPQSAIGNYTVYAINTATTCARGMAGSATVIINTLPIAYMVSGGGNYCSGGSGLHVLLNNSQIGVNYELYLNGSGTLLTLPGGGALDFGLQTAPGVYTVVGTNGPGCSRTMNGSATINVWPLPAVYNVTGGGDYCVGGSGYHIGLALSSIGINYQLKNGVTNVGTPLAGIGSALDFGIKTAAGNYTVVATNPVTGCSQIMGSSAAIVINPLPTVYTVTGGGAYCTGDTGVHVFLSNAETGVDYALWNGTTLVNTVPGISGLPLDFGLQTAAGTYTVKAHDVTTTCNSNMVSSANVVVNPLPVAYNVTGGGNYCTGGTGVHVMMSNSNTGVDYTLNYLGSPIATFSGTGAPLDFGLQTGAGTYTVDAVNNTTTCVNTMSGMATIGIDLPVMPSVSFTPDTETVCGINPTMFVATPVNGGSSPSYDWYVNSVLVGSGSAYSYTVTNGDTVKAILTSNAYCVSPATAEYEHIITANAGVTPAVTITRTGTATLCAANPSVTFSIATSIGQGPTPTYSWLKNGIPVSSATSFTYNAVNGDVVFLLMNSSDECRTANTVFSPNATLIVNEPVTPVFEISANPGGAILPNQSITYTAAVTQGASGATYQWKKNGANIAGANAATYTTSSLVNGDILYCAVTSNNTCGSITVTHSLLINVYDNVGVKQVTSASDVKLVPNPNKGTFTLKGSLGTVNDEEVAIEVTNMLGQVVYSNKHTAQNGTIDQQIRLSNTLANGMYILNLRSGSETTTFHFVIEQ